MQPEDEAPDTHAEGDVGPWSAFLMAWAADCKRGEVRDVSAYLEEFPGCEDRIRNFLAKQQEASTMEAEDKHSTPRSLHETETIGPYRIQKELGRGGQGVVYLASDTRLHRLVAIKVLTAYGAPNEAALIRFRREAEVASRLNHPGICPVFDMGTSDSGPYLVMPYFPGETLADRIRNRSRGVIESIFVSLESQSPATKAEDHLALSGDATYAVTNNEELNATLQLTEAVASALHAAHEVGIIHRDIKPSNILISNTGQPIILDFGLAQDESDDGQGLTRTGDLFGTPPYMSPEQVAGGASSTDRRTDVWSLGVTLYESLTGQRPFDAPTRMQLFQTIQDIEPIDPRRLNRSISRDLSVVMRCALSKSKNHRYQTAQAFAEDLARVRRHEPVHARPAGPILRLSRWFERNPALALSVCAAFLILVAGIIVATTLAADARQATRKAIAERTAYERLADQGRLEDLIAEFHELWPATPVMVPRLKSWIEEGEDLLSRLPDHRARLAELQSRPASVSTVRRIVGNDSDSIRERMRELVLERDHLRSWAEHLERLSDGEATSSVRKAAEVRARLPAVESMLQKFQQDHPVEEVPVLDSPEDQWRHDRLQELVLGLERLGQASIQDPTLAAMRYRLELAERIAPATVSEHEEAWSRLLAELEENDTYRGILRKPQLGLIPLGRNAQGFYDFLHWVTHAPDSTPNPSPYDDQGRLMPGAGLVLTLLPGGSFTMGSPPGEDGRSKEEREHLVTLKPFFIGKHEVTQAQWVRMMGSNPSEYYAGRKHELRASPGIELTHPVESVSWMDARNFVRRLGLELPTEAQWEYAARGGTSTAWCFGPDESDLKGKTNLYDEGARDGFGQVERFEPVSWDDGFIFHGPVDAGSPNPFGLHGIHGNVSEWCRETWRSHYPPDSVVPGDGALIGNFYDPSIPRMFRDGSWLQPASKARSATRFALPGTTKAKFIGIRVVRPLDP
jgi:serine/threonine protein kinase/formylglycine-generating enzyme required for sulfatase activity